MKTAVLLLLALAPQDDALGVLRLACKHPALQPANCAVYRRDAPHLEAAFLASQQHLGPDSTADAEVLVVPPKTAQDEERKTYSMFLPPGTYSVRIPTKPGRYYWLDNVKISAKGTQERPLDLPPSGSLKASWSIDRSVQGSNPSFLLNAALVRDGRVWAFADGIREKTFLLAEVPAGVYTLVVSEASEGFWWNREGVVIEAAKETAVSVEAKRGELGGIHIEFTDPSGRRISRKGITTRVTLVEEKGRLACLPDLFVKQVSQERFTWVGIPVTPLFTLHAWMEGYQPLEKRGIKLKAPTLKKEGAQEVEVYPIQKFTLQPLK